MVFAWRHTAERLNAFLKKFFESPLVVEIVDDSYWQKFPDVGAALRLVATKEECLTGAFCAAKNVWAFGVSMMSSNRNTNAKVALAVTLFLLAEGSHSDRLSQYSQLTALALQAHQQRCVRKRSGWMSAAADALAGFRRRCHNKCSSLFIGKQLRISSPCEGSTVHWAHLRSHGQNSVSWDGFWCLL